MFWIALDWKQSLFSSKIRVEGRKTSSRASAIYTVTLARSSVVNNIVDSVLTQQEKDDLLQQQELTPEGGFPCSFPGCDKSFKYNGKSRRSHELSHEPPVQLEEEPPTLATSKPVSPPKETKERDDAFNYNCSLFTDSFLL